MFDRSAAVEAMEASLGDPIPAGLEPGMDDVIRIAGLAFLAPAERITLVMLLGWNSAGRWMTRMHMRDVLGTKDDTIKARTKLLADKGLIHRVGATAPGLPPVTYFHAINLVEVRRLYGGE